jgi:putative transposase
MHRAESRLLGFDMSDRHDAELAVASLRMAAGLFAGACRSLGVVQSMGRVGSALDNAAVESFFSTLEH